MKFEEIGFREFGVGDYVKCQNGFYEITELDDKEKSITLDYFGETKMTILDVVRLSGFQGFYRKNYFEFLLKWENATFIENECLIKILPVSSSNEFGQYHKIREVLQKYGNRKWSISIRLERNCD